MRKLYYIPPSKFRKQYRRHREWINIVMMVLVLLPVAMLVWKLMFL